jgi:outer membrane protein, adhesin transport system
MLRIIFFFSLIVLTIPFGGDCQTAAGDQLADSMTGIEANPVLEVPDLHSGNQQFYHLIQPVLEQHERIQSAHEAVGVARETIGIVKGTRYPTLQATGGWGYRNEDKANDTEDFSDSFGNLNLGLRQILYDFGKSNASIKQSRLELIGQELVLRQTRRQLILDAAAAYQNLHKTYMLLDFAKEAEMTASDKVERETGRAILIGQQTDLRELEYQLAETVSKRIQCEGNYQLAQNIWLEFFSALPEDISALKSLDLSSNAELPQSIDQALETAQDNSPDIRIARNQQAIVELTLKYEKKNAFFPDINLVMDSSFENNLRDDSGKMDTYKAMVEFRKDINLGLADLHRIGAAERMVRKKNYEMADQLRIVETDTRNAWHSLKTAETYTETLAHQAALTADLLDMARREHETGGEKTIMDVLAGETNLINARSASYNAQIDISLAALNLLGTMGTLNIEMFAGEEEELEESTEPAAPFLDYNRFLNSYKLYDNVRDQSGVSVFQCAYDAQGGYYELFNVGQRTLK